MYIIIDGDVSIATWEQSFILAVPRQTVFHFHPLFNFLANTTRHCVHSTHLHTGQSSSWFSYGTADLRLRCKHTPSYFVRWTALDQSSSPHTTAPLTPCTLSSWWDHASCHSFSLIARQHERERSCKPLATPTSRQDATSESKAGGAFVFDSGASTVRGSGRGFGSFTVSGHLRPHPV